jgi:small subunit ribosomal protein S8
MTDPIADMINRLKNAQAVRKETVEVPFSKIRFEIGKVLERTGYVGRIELKTKRARRPLEIVLRYEKSGAAKIRGVRRVSTPGKRIYATVADLGKRGGKTGTQLVSTSKGLMTGGEARKAKLGGEVLFEIW